MKLLTYIGALAVACALMVLFAVSAEAQTQSTGSAIFEVVRPFLVEIASALILALVGWLVTLVQRKFGIEIEAKHREALQTALTNGAGLVINRMGSIAAAVNLPAGAAQLRPGIEYVVNGAPDAMKYFGITPENAAAKLTEKLEAKIGLIAAAPVVVEPSTAIG